MAGLRLRKKWENGQDHPTGALWVPPQICPQPFAGWSVIAIPCLGTLVPDDTPGTAKLYTRWMALSLGERAAWNSLLLQSIEALPGLAYSNPAVTTWCSYFLPWEKREGDRLRPLWGQLHLGLPHWLYL